MINKHEFQLLAKAFRAGRLTLQQLTDQTFASNSASKKSPSSERREDSPSTGVSTGRNSEISGIKPNENGLPKLLPRKKDSHKRDYGKVLLIGGSVGMSGAISLAGLGALRGGAGLVRLMVPGEILSTVAIGSHCYMTVGCSSEGGQFSVGSLSKLKEATEWADVVVLGPGMGRSPATKEIADTLYRQISKPMVVDADALNGLTDANTDLAEHAGPRLLTPHAGEFQRLLKCSVGNPGELRSRGIELAAKNQLVLILKGDQTMITDGANTFSNNNGNPGMATGGSGDVLSGILGALLGQGLSPIDSARLGVYFHGAAGDLAASELGQCSMIASDIVDFLGRAMMSCS